MREYIPRFDTAAEGKDAAIIAELYYNWTNMHLSVKNDRSDAVPWRDWDDAPRVGRKAVAIQMAAGIADTATQENFLARYEINLGRILYQESEYTDATQVLSDAFARLNNKTGWDHLWERCGFLRGPTMLISGRAAEAEAHFRECIEEPGPRGHPILLDEDCTLTSTALRAEAFAIQGRNEEALALVEGMKGWSSYAGDWTE